MNLAEKRGLGLFLTLVIAIVACGLAHAVLPSPRPHARRISAVNNLAGASSYVVPVATDGPGRESIQPQ